MSLTYSTFKEQIANLMVVRQTDANFLTDLPGIIDYAEQRIYRELDLLTTRVTDDSGTLVQNQRTFTLPTTFGRFLVIEEISVITPFTATVANGTCVPLVPITKQFIDAVWPNATTDTGTPEFFAMLDDQTVLLGPSPDAAYPVEVIGTQRPLPLSDTNVSTWLTLYLPDLFLAAAMVRACAYQRNWSAQGDDPKMALSWENSYQQLKASAAVEEFRKFGRSQGWTAEAPSPIATPPRT